MLAPRRAPLPLTPTESAAEPAPASRALGKAFSTEAPIQSATKVSSGARFDHPGHLICLWLTLSGRLGPIYACICPRAAAALMNCSSTLASPEGGQGTALHRPSGYGTEVKFVCFRFARAPPGAAASRLRFGRPSSSSPAGRPCFFACLFWRASAHADRRRPCTRCKAVRMGCWECHHAIPRQKLP